jgi:hypothetical protein
LFRVMRLFQGGIGQASRTTRVDLVWNRKRAGGLSTQKWFDGPSRVTKWCSKTWRPGSNKLKRSCNLNQMEHELINMWPKNHYCTINLLHG